MTREAFQCKQRLDTRDAGGPQAATIAEGVSGRCAAPAGVAPPRAAEEPAEPAEPTAKAGEQHPAPAGGGPGQPREGGPRERDQGRQKGAPN